MGSGQHLGVKKCNVTCNKMTSEIPVALLVHYQRNQESCGKPAIMYVLAFWLLLIPVHILSLHLGSCQGPQQIAPPAPGLPALRSPPYLHPRVKVGSSFPKGPGAWSCHRRRCILVVLKPAGFIGGGQALWSQSTGSRLLLMGCKSWLQHSQVGWPYPLGIRFLICKMSSWEDEGE